MIFGVVILPLLRAIGRLVGYDPRQDEAIADVAMTVIAILALVGLVVGGVVLVMVL